MLCKVDNSFPVGSAFTFIQQIHTKINNHSTGINTYFNCLELYLIIFAFVHLLEQFLGADISKYYNSDYTETVNIFNLLFSIIEKWKTL